MAKRAQKQPKVSAIDEWTISEREYRNWIWETISHTGLEAWEFSLRIVELTDGSVVLELLHKRTSEYFFFGGYCFCSKPGTGRSESFGSVASTHGNWKSGFRLDDEVKAHCSKWLNALKNWLDRLQKHLATPDLWQTSTKQRALQDLGSTVEEDDRPFTEDERHELTSKMEELKKVIATSQTFTSDQLSQINYRLDRAESVAKKLARKDWLTWFMGTVTSISITASFAPETTRLIVQKAAELLQPLFQVLPRLL